MRPRNRILLGAAIVAVLGAGGAAAAGLGGADPPGPSSPRTAPAATTPVLRETLVESATLAGELGYGPATPLASAAEGTVTWLPEVGTTIVPGGALLRVDEQPIVLLAGNLPMYRALAEGSRGLDVRQFERNLVDLRFGPVTVDDVFTASTTAAVKRWQRSLGLPETGIVEKFRVVYATGPVRVEQHLVRLGRPATGDVLTYTGGTKVVSILASPAEIAWAARGTKVTVVLPGGRTLDGAVAAIGTEATAVPGGGPPDPASPGTGTARISLTVTIADQAGIGALEKSPVDVRYVARQRENVLTVPVSALLALAEGGYGVEIVDGDGSRIVAVQAGLFAGGRVEITGPGIDEGVAVGIPQ